MLAKALNMWSLPGGLEGSLNPIEAIRLAREYGFDSLELCFGDERSALPVDADPAAMTGIVAAARNASITLDSTASGLYWNRNLGDADPDLRAQAQHDLTRMIQLTAALGARTLLTIPGAVDVFFLPDRPAQPAAEVRANVAEGLAALLPVAERHGVRLGIENVWNKFLLSAHEMAHFIDGFNSPWLGAYVDVANLMPFGYPDHWLRELGHRVVGVHFKDFRRAVGTAEGFVDLLEGDVDWPAVMDALDAIGYDGPVVAEMIPLYRHHPLVRIGNTSRAMDAILGR